MILYFLDAFKFKSNFRILSNESFFNLRNSSTKEFNYISRIVFISTLLISFFDSAYSQPIFGYSYLNTPTSNSGTVSEITNHFDGGIVGINLGTANSNFTLFKLSSQGNMEWKKQITFPFSWMSNSRNIITLNDSTFAVINEVSNSIADLAAIKFDNNGNVIWTKLYSGMENNFHYLTSFGQNGFVFSDDGQIAYVNEYGNITKSYLFENQIHIRGVLNYDDDKIRVFGTTQLHNHLIVFDIDTTGIITNSFEYSFFGDSLILGGQEQIAKSPNGGTYCLSYLTANCPPSALGVFHFDALNQLVWAKKIDCAGQFPCKIIAAENGCMISANHVISWPNVVPMVYKLDSTGTLEWMKMPGDPSVPIYNYRWIESIVPDSGNGWYCVMKKNNLHFFHLDSALNGFCVYQNFSTTISDIVCVGNSFVVTDSLVMMTDSTIEVTQLASSWFQYDACTGVLIDSLTGINENLIKDHFLSIFPNPSNNKITITIPDNFLSGIISIFSSTGAEVLQQAFIKNQNVELDIHHLDAGFYLVQLKNEFGSYSGKLFKYE